MGSSRERWETTLDVAGVLLVLGPLFLVEAVAVQSVLVLGGLLLVADGLRTRLRRLLPDARIYLRLREETEIFLDQVRALNELAVEDERPALERQRDRLLDQVDRIVDSAGVEA